MDKNRGLDRLGELLDSFFPEDRSRGPSWHQSPYDDDLRRELVNLQECGATAEEVNKYIVGSWSIARSSRLSTDVARQLEEMQQFIREWFTNPAA